MRFTSTRGKTVSVSFEEALLSGYAPDGGLYLPQGPLSFTKNQLRAWSSLTYPQLVKKLLRLFIDEEELSNDEIEDLMDNCYSEYDFPDRVVATRQVGPLTFAELWHGPTGAFKDLSLVIVSRLINHFLRKRDKHSAIIVSTSGDTGGAAIQSVLGLERIQLMVMYPRHMVSRVQELQMTTKMASNVHVFSVDGTSDDTDVVMAEVFSDSKFVEKYNLNNLNSLNIGRILIQSIHFVYLYLQECPEVDRELLFCLPTGGMGNISSGMFARKMGIPIKFLAAVNENNTVHKVFQSEIYEVPLTVHKTLSNAMDISVPYNMERMLYYLSDEQPEQVKEIMEEFDKKSKSILPPSIMASNTCVTTACVLDDKVLSTMQEISNGYSYLICPHTAVATRAALDLLEERKLTKEGASEKLIIVCTATPDKFPEAVDKAGLVLPPCPKFDVLRNLPERKNLMNKDENWCEILKHSIEKAWE